MKKIYFTLLELMIVVAIIMILVGILLPGLKKARGMAQRIKCTNNEKQIALATISYIQDNNQYFFPSISNSICWPRLLLYDYIQSPETFRCPSSNLNPDFWTKSWAASKLATSSSFFVCPYGVNFSHINGGYRYTNDWNSPPAKISQIRAPSLTIFLGDSKEDSYPEGYYIFSDIYTTNKLHPRHDSGVVVLWTDGHVSYNRTDKNNPYQTPPFNGGGAGKNGNPDNYFDR